ncbi:hypothetical protein HELRODRAFT_186940 [Helobdella robusta]|uniref:non-specific protein-tyrosine kinase n=1 Tax=Helobdella robusta TaxID=6412 RepID=T1FP45_HELRO|nr:hypothetical protein HELRODRAFT_186940 [Helobdella robusta]ESO05602.1 hypothetical protein HELRODRAFT_186940 [Helobdella robusta]
MCCKLTLPMPYAAPAWPSPPTQGDGYEIARNRLCFETRLGQGQFGEVWKGKWFNKPVAIKAMKFGSMQPEKFLEEAKVMKQLKHSKLVALLGVCSDQQPFYIVTELVSKGSLLQFLRTDEGKSLIILELINISSQVAEGMLYLEMKKYVHRDLAARNVLVGSDNAVKIADFGLTAKIMDLDRGDLMKNDLVPIKWTALEALYRKQFSTKSDVWAFGILLVEITTYGQTPYKDMNSKETLAFLESGKRHPKPAHCPEELYEEMMKCWNKNPDDRPTFEHLNDFLNGYYINIEKQNVNSSNISLSFQFPIFLFFHPIIRIG